MDKTIRLARRAGIGNINLDLIFGIPGQSLDDWNETLDAALSLKPDHISAYGLIPEEGTPIFERINEGKLSLPDPETERIMYDRCIQILSDNGYMQYEISNFARKNRECIHNIGYWTQEPYIGLGISASSMSIVQKGQNGMICRRKTNPQSIDEYEDHAKTDSYVNVPSFYLVGTKIIQNDILRFRLICNRVKKEYEGEISIESIQSYLNETHINVYDDIENIKLSVEYSNDSWTPYKPISEYLEFITDDNFCLRNGKWCLFNSAYISQVLRDVNKIDFENHSDDPWTLNYSDLLAFAKTEGIYIDRDKQPYETYYNHKLNKKLKGKMIHPKTIPVDENEDKRYKYEVCDLEKDGHMYFVKIGQPSSFAYAVDQANLTLTKIVNGNGKIKLPDGDICEPNCFHLVLVCNNRKTIINNWKDILSINFLIHLSELKYNLNSTNISLKVDFAYNN